MAFPNTSGCGENGSPKADEDKRRPVMVRVPPQLLERIDKAAKRLGLSRAAFMLAATADRVEKMED